MRRRAAAMAATLLGIGLVLSARAARRPAVAEGAAGGAAWRPPAPSASWGCVAVAGRPDPRCTPGDLIPGCTAELICDPSFRTRSIRDTQTSSGQKNIVYRMYGMPHPRNNNGAQQTVEKDHLVPLELCGADTIANVWPEGSPGANWDGPGFREKDSAENFAWYEVCVTRTRSLPDAQRAMATDWRGYWEAAGRPACKNRHKC
jgi:hypothetical protein